LRKEQGVFVAAGTVLVDVVGVAEGGEGGGTRREGGVGGVGSEIERC